MHIVCFRYPLRINEFKTKEMTTHENMKTEQKVSSDKHIQAEDELLLVNIKLLSHNKKSMICK